MTAVPLLLLVVVAAAPVLYWLVVLTEGAYLGSPAVTFLYDRGATSYDEVKQFDAVDDASRLALPLIRRLRGHRAPLVLDVATGTARLPVSLLRSLEFEGSIVGLDLSMGMLREAARKTARYGERVSWLCHDAMDLPFGEDSFQAVVCLEALEFMPRPARALEEIARVLRAGGTLLASNRRGLDAFLMPGRAFSKDRLKDLLGGLSFVSVEIEQWQTYYDLVWARKEGSPSRSEEPRALKDVLRCPHCQGRAWSWGETRLNCHECGSAYIIKDGIIHLERPAEDITRHCWH
jgi:ubiquinone/menaquinone biosynthesis C-methylase UbiE